MRICYVGDFYHSWSTETHVAESLRLLGHEVTCVDGHAVSSPAARASGIMEDAADDSDLVIYVQGPWTQDDVRACRTPTLGYHLDLFFGLARQTQISRDAIFACDVVCTPDAGHEPDWRFAGVNHVPVRAGVYGPEAVGGVAPPQGLVDVAFVGSTTRYHPEWPHRYELIRHLIDWYGPRLALIGDGQRVHGRELNRVYASVPVIVGDSCFASREARYWSDRPYEVWGRGGFLLMPQIDALADEIGLYPSWEIGRWDDLHDTIESWLGDAYARDGTRAQLAARVRERCTYTQRAQELLDAAATL